MRGRVLISSTSKKIYHFVFEVRQLLTETSNDGSSLITVKALTQTTGHNYNNYLKSMKPLSASDESLIISRFLYRTDITVEKLTGYIRSNFLYSSLQRSVTATHHEPDSIT